jgi:hypothetical protein
MMSGVSSRGCGDGDRDGKICGVMSEQRWNTDKQRFVDEARSAELVGRPSRRDHGFPLGPLGQQFATLTYSLLDATTVEEVLQQVVSAAAGLVPEADMVSVTLRGPDGRYHTPVATDAAASALDQTQSALGEGPCLEAAEPAGPAMAFCRDLAAELRWPRFAAAARRAGAGTVMATALVPSPVPPQHSGSLNLYARSPHTLDDVDPDLVLLLATHASLAVAGVDAVTRADLEITQLHTAISSRDVLGQAKGILMARRGIGADAAFDILRRTSQKLNIKLVALAEALASRHTELDVPPAADPASPPS